MGERKPINEQKHFQGRRSWTKADEAARQRARAFGFVRETRRVLRVNGR